MRMHDLRDTLPRKRLLPEPDLDIVQHLRVRGVALVEHVLQSQVRGAEAVAEVLGEDPAAVCPTPRGYASILCMVQVSI